MNGRTSDSELIRTRPSPVIRTELSEKPRAVAANSGFVQESLMEEYMRTLGRHRPAILVGALAGLGFAMLLVLPTQPVYTTRTSLDIRSLNTEFMDIHSIAPTSGGSDEVNTNLQTQIRMLQSETLLQNTIARVNSLPHPESFPRNDILSRLERTLHLGGDDSIPYEKLVEDASHRIKVKPLGLSRLVEVSCASWDAQFSALFCNSVVATYEQQDLQTRATEALKTQQWLTRQVADVGQHAQELQKRLEAAVGGNGLMLSQTTTSAGEEKLRALQQELVRAQADRMQKEATVDIARTAAPETEPDVQDNPAHRAYELKLAELRAQLSQLLSTYTEENPKVIKMRAQIVDTEAGLRASAKSSISREANEYQAARHREELLGQSYKAQEAAVSADLQKSAQVSLLRKEVDSEQQLYQTLLQRAKEAGFASAMQAATIRVVDQAKPPRAASAPRTELIGALGLSLGALFGVGLAFYRERSSRVVRVPGEVSRLLQMHELGVIPAVSQAARGMKHSETAMLHVSPLHTAQRFGAAITRTRWEDNFSLTAEAYRNAVISIMLAEAGKKSRTYVVSSPNMGEGKTTVTSNLGVALSKSKLRVVLVDGDLRRPNLHNAFAVDNAGFGLRNILRGEVDLDSVPTDVLTHCVGLPNIALIPAGEGDEDVVGLLHEAHLGALLSRLSNDFDVILVDSSPLLHMADARVIAGHCDGGILVFRAGVTPFDDALHARDMFLHDRIPLLGTILNDFNPAAEGQPDYYDSYYRYGSGDHTQRVSA